MRKLDINCLATINFEITWENDQVKHKEYYLGRKVNLWRDIFPPGMKEKIIGLPLGGEVSLSFEPGQAVPARHKSHTLKTDPKHFIRKKFLNKPVIPRRGRFYPRSLLGGLYFFPQDKRPCRITSIKNDSIEADCGHPLADQKISIKAKVLNFAENSCETGGRLNHWAEKILDTGPGMQARYRQHETDFASSGFERADDDRDSTFYQKPRLIDHVDRQASDHMRRNYSSIITPGMKVLDLMSSVNSHLPEDFDLDVIGLGMNMEEIQANPLLSAHIVHDLNLKPELPFADSSFDAVICSLSVEYLTHPYRVAREASRILKPGGAFIVGFSNRWFPAKVTELWQELHEFERIGFVLDLFLKTDSFENLSTTSIRNWWRPENDAHINQTWISDPVYIVNARKP
ncbi:MAG: class I SAM-dependent methyltransferase [Desulfonatronovibrio sp. MSAO_Bac4]|nr:MAG: class I SAM-dependent methyltransferase [Desulfonatronovibrio sp. MSAO_Bac4]